LIALSASQPYRKAVERGQPRTMGFSAALASCPKKDKLQKPITRERLPTRTNKCFFLIPITSLKEIYPHLKAYHSIILQYPQLTFISS
jgi:hypothetical protein